MATTILLSRQLDGGTKGFDHWSINRLFEPCRVVFLYGDSRCDAPSYNLAAVRTARALFAFESLRLPLAALSMRCPLEIVGLNFEESPFAEARLKYRYNRYPVVHI